MLCVACMMQQLQMSCSAMESPRSVTGLVGTESPLSDASSGDGVAPEAMS